MIPFAAQNAAIYLTACFQLPRVPWQKSGILYTSPYSPPGSTASMQPPSNSYLKDMPGNWYTSSLDSL